MTNQNPPHPARPTAQGFSSLLNLVAAGALLCLISFSHAADAAGGKSRVILYVDNTGGNDITVVDTVTNKAIGSIDVGAAPHGLAGSPDGTRLYVSSEGEDTLTAIDTTTSTVLWRRPVGVRPNEISTSADGRYVYVPIRSADYVDVVDTETRRTIKSIPVGPRPHNSYRSPNGKWIYVTSMGGGSFSIIDIATQSVIATIPVGGEPRPLAISNDDRFVYVQLTGWHGYVVADVEARKVVASIQLPPADSQAVSAFGYTPSHGLGLSKDNKQLWCTNVYGNAISVFSVPDNKQIASVPVGSAPNWVDFTPDGKFIYVSNPGSNNVSAIDTNALKEVARIPVGLAPKRVVIVNVPYGMGGPGEPGWIKAAARPSTNDYYLKDGGLISCETNSFRDKFQSGELTAETAPAFYHKLGGFGVDLDARYVRSWDDASLDRIIQALHKEKRTLTALNIEGNLVSDDAEANQRQVEEDKRLIRAARYLGAPVVCLSLGRTGSGDAADSAAVIDRAIASLRQLVPVAREQGVRITFENGNGPAKMPDDIVKIIQGTDPVWVGLCFNFGNWEDQKAMRSAIEKLAPYVYHTHVICSAFDHFANESTIDYAYALPQLAKAGYGSALSIGYAGKGKPEEGVAGMRDLLVKLWIGKGTAPRPMAPGHS